MGDITTTNYDKICPCGCDTVLGKWQRDCGRVIACEQTIDCPCGTQFTKPKTGHHSILCLDCRKERNRAKMREWGKRNRERKAAYRREHGTKKKEHYTNYHKTYMENLSPDKVKSLTEYYSQWRRSDHGRYRAAISHAKYRGVEFKLTFEEFAQASNQPCFYCNHQFCHKSITGSNLDRLDSDVGYIPGNVVACGTECNKLKSNILTSTEFKAAMQAILKTRNITKGNKQ